MGRERNCDACGKPYVAQRPTSRYCSSGCRTTVTRRKARGEVVPMRPAEDADGEVYRATLRELEGLSGADSAAGALALGLARRVDRALGSVESGTSLAALTKELRAAIAEVTRSGRGAADPVDQLRARREARLRGAG